MPALKGSRRCDPTHRKRPLSSYADWLRETEDDGRKAILDIDGEKYLRIAAAQSPAGWRLVDFIPVEDVYRNVNQLRNFILLIAGIVMLLTVPAATFLSRKITMPILRLTAGFKKVETGNFNMRMEPNLIMEFSYLSQSYNSMVEQLHMLMHRLEEEHRLKREVELRLLQSQINPHFLYNTLDMINWMAAVKGVHEVSRMASRLAKLFRISLSKKGPFVMLDEELDHALVYVQIQQARFYDQFEFIDDIPESFKGYCVPRIILQPFIENAIAHGFTKAMKDKAKVIVSAKQAQDDRFMLIVEDNGQGLRKNWQEHVEQAGQNGHGIANVDQRIKLYFGPEYGVRLMPREPHGVRVEILLPVMTSPQMRENNARWKNG